MPADCLEVCIPVATSPNAFCKMLGVWTFLFALVVGVSSWSITTTTWNYQDALRRYNRIDLVLDSQLVEYRSCYDEDRCLVQVCTYLAVTKVCKVVVDNDEMCAVSKTGYLDRTNNECCMGTSPQDTQSTYLALECVAAFLFFAGLFLCLPVLHDRPQRTILFTHFPVEAIPELVLELAGDEQVNRFTCWEAVCFLCSDNRLDCPICSP